MRSPRLRLLLLPVLAAPMSCAHYAQEDGERLANEVYALQTQVNALQRAQADLVGKGSKLNQQLGEVSKLFRRNGADFMVEIETMREEFARLKGGVEAFHERMSSVEANLSKAQEDSEVRFQALNEKAEIDAAKSETARRKVLQDKNRRTALLSDPARLFKEVERRITNQKPGGARKLLRQFMLRAENRTGLKKHQPKAQYLIGETFLGERKFQQAAAEYNAVRKRYPSSRWVPDALYKLGFCFEKLKLPEDARLFYNMTVNKHGTSNAAKKARTRLKTLK